MEDAPHKSAKTLDLVSRPVLQVCNAGNKHQPLGEYRIMDTIEKSKS
jgi:hypothetical protein